MTERTNNNKKVIDYLYQMFLVLLGAGIALGSSWITQSWQHTKERKELVNHIKGSVQNDIKNIDGTHEFVAGILERAQSSIICKFFSVAK